MRERNVMTSVAMAANVEETFPCAMANAQRVE
jgi:hypothetical protein